MKKLNVILLAISLFAVSCTKDDLTIDEGTETSFTMNYDGQTYTEVEANSLSLIGGNIAVAGTAGNEFLLTVLGVGADGTTVNICTDYESCENMCTLTLDFGAVEGKEALVATSGTIKRTGKIIEISASGVSTSFETKSLTATIVVGNVIEF